MDIEKLIERLKHNYHGYSTVENNPEETFHDMVECLTALSTLQAENEKLREMYQKEKAVCHAVQAELENYRNGHREAAISTLTPLNEPLTLNELREMDGEPVWVDDEKTWAILQVWDDQNIDAVFPIQRGCFRAESVLGMKIYRRPPEGEEYT